MVEIIFQNRIDAVRFYEYLLARLEHNQDSENILLLEDRYIVKIFEGSYTEFFLNEVKNAFFEFITYVKRDDWFKEILAQQFYFTDDEEQQQILDILHSILEGKREDLSVFIREVNEEAEIREAIDYVFQEKISFSFDSFFTFRLQVFRQLLESYVEVSIDEYKMEQDYQMFVHMLRDFLASRESKMDILHLLFDEEITFFNQDFVEMKRSELTRMIDRKLLVNHPVYVDSTTIAPLLSIAPTTIFLYAKDAEAPLVRTIKNIFEERVIIKPYGALRSVQNGNGDQYSAENHG
ncbi:sporulation protein YtxC [Neobacillus sp. LXY-1]|uniref:sporulation protein YtxC n=1 Tax=Neobacillus sp. LXY-1 TaxID=3379133 RepID=UPI003EE27EE6